MSASEMIKKSEIESAEFDTDKVDVKLLKTLNGAYTGMFKIGTDKIHGSCRYI